jgi:amidohydrolase
MYIHSFRQVRWDSGAVNRWHHPMKSRFVSWAGEVMVLCHIRRLIVDPILISAQIITALQSVVSRVSDPTMPSVLTIGKINSEGGAFNVIPDSVTLLGTFRTFDESWRSRAHEKIREIVHGIAVAHGAVAQVEIQIGYPVLLNDAMLTQRCRDAARTYLGEAQVHEIPQRLTSEDFAFYTHQVPGCFYRLGVGNPAKGIISPVHTPTFDIDEQALETGAGLLAWLAVTELNQA